MHSNHKKQVAPHPRSVSRSSSQNDFHSDYNFANDYYHNPYNNYQMLLGDAQNYQQFSDRERYPSNSSNNRRHQDREPRGASRGRNNHDQRQFREKGRDKEHRTSYTNSNDHECKMYTCPSCQFQYEIHPRGFKSVSKLPLVITCQHTVCQDCILKSANNTFECPTCKTASPVPRNCTPNSIQEIFPPNIYMYGLLSWHKSQSNNMKGFALAPVPQSANKKLFDLDLKPEITAICCFVNCNRKAVVNCRDCNDVYCKLCSVSVHQSAKSLWSHRQVPLSEGNIFVELEKCKEHNMDAEIFCKTCEQGACCYCFLEKHEGHEKDYLSKLVESEQSEFAASRAKVERSFRQLLISQKKLNDLKNTSNSTIEKKICQNFIDLHSKLQLLEKNLRVQLSTMNDTDKSVKGLENINSKINNSLQQVKHVLFACEMMEEKKVNIKEIFKQLKEVENMPCYLLKDQNGELEPISFTIDPAINHIDDLFKITKSDDSEYLLVSEDALPEGYEKTDIIIDNDAASVLSSIRQSIKENTKKKKSIDTRSISSDYMKKCDREMVEVTHIESLDRFYVQQKKVQYRLIQMNKEIENYVPIAATVDLPQLNELYIVLYINNNEKTWCRGRIIDVKNGETEPLYEVFFIDYGTTKTVDISKLREITSGIAQRKAFAIQCELYNPTYVNWSKSAHVYMGKIINGKELCMMIKNIQSGVHQVDLMVSSSDGGFTSIIDILIHTCKNALNHSSDDSLDSVNNVGFPFHYTQDYKIFSNNTKFQKNQIEKVTIANIIDPHHIYVHNAAHSEALKKLIAAMKSYYKRSTNTFVPIEGNYVVVEDKDPIRGNWHRAFIKKVDLCTEEVHVKCVDWGTNLTVSFSSVRMLTENFTRLESQAIYVKLAHIEPYNKAHVWSDRANMFLQRFFRTQEVLKMIVHNEDPLEVALFQMETEMDICINTLLVQEKLADSTGKAKFRLSNELMCNYCQKQGHKASKCRKWKANGKPPILKKSDEIAVATSNCDNWDQGNWRNDLITTNSCSKFRNYNENKTTVPSNDYWENQDTIWNSHKKRSKSKNRFGSRGKRDSGKHSNLKNRCNKSVTSDVVTSEEIWNNCEEYNWDNRCIPSTSTDDESNEAVVSTVYSKSNTCYNEQNWDEENWNDGCIVNKECSNLTNIVPKENWNDYDENNWDVQYVSEKPLVSTNHNQYEDAVNTRNRNNGYVVKRKHSKFKTRGFSKQIWNKWDKENLNGGRRSTSGNRHNKTETNNMELNWNDYNENDWNMQYVNEQPSTSKSCGFNAIARTSMGSRNGYIIKSNHSKSKTRSYKSNCNNWNEEKSNNGCLVNGNRPRSRNCNKVTWNLEQNWDKDYLTNENPQTSGNCDYTTEENWDDCLPNEEPTISGTYYPNKTMTSTVSSSEEKCNECGSNNKPSTSKDLDSNEVAASPVMFSEEIWYEWSQVLEWPQNVPNQPCFSEEEGFVESMLKKVDESCEENESEDEEEKKSFKQKIEIVKFVNPDLIYIKFVTSDDKERSFLNELQAHYTNEKNGIKESWKEGEICVVVYKKFYARGKVVGKEGEKYRINIMDYVDEIVVGKENMYVYATYFNKYKSIVFKAYLANIRPAGGDKWSLSSIEALEKIFQTHKEDIFGAKVLDDSSKKSFAMKMWYTQVKIAGALEASVTRYISINNFLVKLGFAYKKFVNPSKEPKTEELKLEFEDLLNLSNSSADSKDWNRIMEEEEKKVDAEKQESPYHTRLAEIKDWKPPFAIDKHEFNAYITCAEPEGILYLREETLQPVYQELEKNIKEYFDNKPQKGTDLKHIWQPGQLCSIAYQDRWYRGKVETVNNSQDISVVMIDFGSDHNVTPQDLFREVLYPEIPAFASKVKLDRIFSKCGKWLTSDYQTLLEIVTEYSRIEVKGPLDAEVPLAEVYTDKGISVNETLVKKCPNLARVQKQPEQSDEDDVVIEEEEALEIKGSPVNTTSFKFKIEELPKNNCPMFIVTIIKYNQIVVKKPSKNPDIRLAKLSQEIQKYAAFQPVVDNIELNIPCIAKYSEDKLWYRAQVYNTDGLSGGYVLVYYVDFGNVESVLVSDVKMMRPEWFDIPITCHMAELNYTMKTDTHLEYVFQIIRKLFGKTKMVEFVNREPLTINLLEENGELSYQTLISSGFIELMNPAGDINNTEEEAK